MKLFRDDVINNIKNMHVAAKSTHKMGSSETVAIEELKKNAFHASFLTGDQKAEVDELLEEVSELLDEDVDEDD